MSYTISEPNNETYSNSTLVITQGFQQSKLDWDGISDLSGMNEAEVFPNPTHDLLEIKDVDLNNKYLIYELFDNSGRPLQHGKFESSKINISLKLLSPSVYFIKITNSYNAIKYFKIIKQ
jgi:hypothetical protein